MTSIRIIAAAAAAFVMPALAAAAALTVGLGTDVTALDPHYHNLTPNNNVASHVFGYLVDRNEKSQPIPGLATEWKTIDPTTWEFKLRKGVKFHDGSDFTAADVVASIERVPRVPNSPSPFTAYPSRSSRSTFRTPTRPLQDGDTVSADALRPDADRDIEAVRQCVDRRFQQRQGRDRYRSLQGRPLREERPDRTCTQ
jgi:ABC-type transport system substrate-binding protein